MKIRELLSENIGAMLAYKNLSPLEANILKRIASDQTIDEDRLSVKATESLENLRSMGLVTDIVPSLTEEGKRAVDMIMKYGSFSKLHRDRLGKTAEPLPRSQDVDFDDDDGDPDLEVE